MLLNKKSILTLFAGAALLSASTFSGVNAFAAQGDGGATAASGSTSTDSTTNPNGPRVLGNISSDNVTTSHDLGSSDNGDKTNQKNGTVTGNSDAHIRVVNGYLVLEEVPSLGFQDVAQSNDHDNVSNKVTDNDTVLKSDSFFNQPTKPTTLTVLDARSGNGNSTNKGGYSVNAKLSPFTNYDSGGNQTNGIDNNGQDGTSNSVGSAFKLTLNGKIANSDKNSSANVPSNVQLTSNNTDNPTVLSSDKIGGGTTSVNYNDGVNNNPTSLDVPAKTPSGNYAAPITWTLNPSSDGSYANKN